MMTNPLFESLRHYYFKAKSIERQRRKVLDANKVSTASRRKPKETAEEKAASHYGWNDLTKEVLQEVGATFLAYIDYEIESEKEYIKYVKKTFPMREIKSEKLSKKNDKRTRSKGSRSNPRQIN